MKRCINAVNSSRFSFFKKNQKKEVFYSFSDREIIGIETATKELYDMSLNLVSDMVKSGNYPNYFNFSDIAKYEIEKSWNRGDLSVIGRFDLTYTNQGGIKLLEYNADTPVLLPESSTVQAEWFKQAANLPSTTKGQYNAIHEHLIQFWRDNFTPEQLIHFTQGDGLRSEERSNLLYLQETAHIAGLKTQEILIEDVGVADHADYFLDLDNEYIRTAMKLYAWEWMFQDSFSSQLKDKNTLWLEPQWKSVLSNKGMLVELWKNHPNHPYLLETFSEMDIHRLNHSKVYCKKAIQGRGGANIYKYHPSTQNEELGCGSHFMPDCGQQGYIYQEWVDIPTLNRHKAILGSWVVGNVPCGLIVRESHFEITGNHSCTVNHVYTSSE